MHIVHRFDGDYFEYDKTFVGTVTLTYNVKADNKAGADKGLRDVAEALSDTGIIGLSSSGYDAKLKKTKANKVR